MDKGVTMHGDNFIEATKLGNPVIDAAIGATALADNCTMAMGAIIAVFGEKAFKDIFLPKMLDQAAEKAEYLEETVRESYRAAKS